MKISREQAMRLCKDPDDLLKFLEPLLEPDFRPVPDFPSVEVSKDLKRVRLVRPIDPQVDGAYVVQVNGWILRGHLSALAKAAFPEKWPEVARAGTLRIDPPKVDPLAERLRQSAKEVKLGTFARMKAEREERE